MKAIICTKYGPPEVLQLKEVEKPTPKKNEVCIKVVVTSVTASDTNVRSARIPIWHPIGFMMRVVLGFKGPRKPILGMVVAGVVESAGSDVTRFQKGDLVYGVTGTSFGNYAEYNCLAENEVLVKKPEYISFQEAAAIAYGANMAGHFIKRGNIQKGQKVLVYGASGAIGTTAVQLAKHLGAEVTGVCSTRNIELVRSLGCDHVVDYTKEERTKSGESYDFIFDAVGKSKSSKLKLQLKQALTQKGKYISVDDGMPQSRIEYLLLLNDLMEAGRFKPVIDRCYPLEEIVEAHVYVDKGRKKGNVLITVGNETI